MSQAHTHHTTDLQIQAATIEADNILVRNTLVQRLCSQLACGIASLRARLLQQTAETRTTPTTALVLKNGGAPHRNAPPPPPPPPPFPPPPPPPPPPPLPLAFPSSPPNYCIWSPCLISALERWWWNGPDGGPVFERPRRAQLEAALWCRSQRTEHARRRRPEHARGG